MDNLRICLSQEAIDAEAIHPGIFNAQPCPMPDGEGVLVRLKYLGMNAGMRSRIGKERDGEGTLHPGDCPTSDAVVEILHTQPTRHAFVQWAPWQQYFRVPASDLIPLPAADPLLFATILGHTGLTAWTSLQLAGLNERDHIVISSAAGGVGVAAVQFALAMGAQVTGIASGDRCEVVQELGAQCLDRKKHLQWPQFTVFHDAIGGKLLEDAINHINQGGRIMICGALAGAAPANYARIIHKDLTLRGFTVMNHLDRRAEFWKQGLRWINDGVARPVYHSVRGLENAGRAFSSMDNAPGVGRQIVDCS